MRSASCCAVSEARWAGAHVARQAPRSHEEENWAKRLRERYLIVRSGEESAYLRIATQPSYLSTIIIPGSPARYARGRNAIREDSLIFRPESP